MRNAFARCKCHSATFGSSLSYKPASGRNTLFGGGSPGFCAFFASALVSDDGYVQCRNGRFGCWPS